MLISNGTNSSIEKINSNTIHNNILTNRMYKSILKLISKIDITNKLSRDDDANAIVTLDYDTNSNSTLIKRRFITSGGLNTPITIDITSILNNSFKSKKRVVHKYDDSVLDEILSLGFSLIGMRGKINRDLYLDFKYTLNGLPCILTINIMGLNDDTKYQVDTDDDDIYYDDDYDSETLNDSYIGSITLDINPYGADKIQDSIDVYNSIIGYFSKATISYNDIINKTEYVNLISTTHSGFTLKSIKLDYINDKFEDLDIHYGDGFEDRYESLVSNIRTSTKGIVLFHGVPGSGKSYCIKHMLRRLDNKCVIFVQPNMINNLTDPSFIGFLTELSAQNKDVKENILLIVEEAESILLSRDNGNVSNGISNLLNSTDGILNSALKIQMILTFNTDKFDIDKAILREGRLIGNFKFGYVTSKNVKVLMDKLKIEDDVLLKSKKTTVSSIYSKLSERQSITFATDENFDDSKKDFIL